VLHLCGQDFLVWSGIELLCLPLMALGGRGFVSALANIAPRAVADMYELWVAGTMSIRADRLRPQGMEQHDQLRKGASRCRSVRA
jgi:4-hydroxy-tetrahydrodipicolinate synthase